MGILRQFAEYLYIKKKNPEQKHDKWLGYMHGMNRISILMFIVALLVILFRLVIWPLIK